MRSALFAVVAFLLVSEPLRAAPAPITLTVDATEAPRRIFHARMAIPVHAGPVTLVYPKWLPGEHGPTGPINDLVGLVVSAQGKRIGWRRGDEDPYAFALEVPAGVSSLDVAFDLVTGVGGRGAPSEPVSSAELLVVKWNHLLLYPKGPGARALPIAAALKLPAGWTHASALALAGKGGDLLRFAPVPLETLVDSPVAAGARGRRFDFGAIAGTPHRLNLFADSSAALEVPAAYIDGVRRLVAEAHALFGGYPYRHYDFLLSLSDFLPMGGLEHHESSDNRLPERALVEESMRVRRASLLPHELVHAWNGKYRRPAGLVTDDYQQPMKTELLWVYEGLTTYYGEVLTARAGLRTPEQAREALALGAAWLAATPGRAWRPLEDTAIAAPVLAHAPKEWRTLRRGLDYYSESQLIWLEADALIRNKTNGQRSLDDFCRRFHGGTTGTPAVKPYSRPEVLAALAEVAPADWEAFFATRVSAVAPKPPLGGIEASGWRLAYRDERPAFFKMHEQAYKEVDLTFSLGLVLRDDGTIVDVIEGGPAARAGLGPAMKVIAVNARRFTPDGLRAAVRLTKTAADIDLLVENADEFRTHHLRWAGGERYPTLERATGPDRLSEILKARTVP